MLDAEFDSYVGEYAAQHAQSIRLSGETPGYFAEYKIRELARMARGWGYSDPQILDFGSGMGNSLPGLRKYFPGSKISAADVSAQSLAAAQRLHGAREAQLLIGAGGIPAPDGSFDISFTACVFHHIPEAEHLRWLSELRRVTRPGGRLVIFEHNPLNPLTRHAVRICPFDANAVLIGSGEMRARMVAAGWDAPKVDHHVFFPRALARLRGLENALRWCPLGGQYAAYAQRG
ncbi:class I SAM-dependent methyltransferase [Citreicella sp. C3M06]|uniref:class I SAM-dependent methyltransferase n=1 Tax=Citreicella sp. C3M06 TaxID=2841564 RepID=UPI001C0844A3|nr:class I SAM-dependent methyltransferase [Citreicella sp. C3M06]MBU2961377.1 class I SAM-dependent methyltransferase [Citreicella sp. C3M06]